MTPAEKVASKKKAKPNTIPWGQRRKARRKVVFANSLVAARSSVGLTIDEAAKGTGLSVNAICDAEAGFEVMLSTALKLATFYGKTVEELWSAATSQDRGSRIR